MFNTDKIYTVTVKKYIQKTITEKKSGDSKRIFAINLEMRDPEGQNVELPYGLKPCGPVVSMKFINPKFTATLDLNIPDKPPIVISDAKITANTLRLGKDGWVMPVIAEVRQSAEMADYLYRYYGSEIGIRLSNFTGKLFGGSQKAKSLQEQADAKKAAAGDVPLSDDQAQPDVKTDDELSEEMKESSEKLNQQFENDVQLGMADWEKEDTLPTPQRLQESHGWYYAYAKKVYDRLVESIGEKKKAGKGRKSKKAGGK